MEDMEDIDKHIENLDEIVSLVKENIEIEDSNVTAILDYEDLISLKHVLDFVKKAREDEKNVDKLIKEYMNKVFGYKENKDEI